MASFFIYNVSILVFASNITPLVNYPSQLIAQSKEIALYKHPRWQAILHVKDGKPLNANDDRYLSVNNFSLAQERC